MNGAYPEGRGVIESEIAYIAEKGEFLLVDPVLELRVRGLDSQRTRVFNEAANMLLQSHITGYPVYRLERTDLKQNMARLVLRDVRVDDGLLKTHLGLDSG